MQCIKRNHTAYYFSGPAQKMMPVVGQLYAFKLSNATRNELVVVKEGKLWKIYDVRGFMPIRAGGFSTRKEALAYAQEASTRLPAATWIKSQEYWRDRLLKNGNIVLGENNELIPAHI